MFNVKDIKVVYELYGFINKAINKSIPFGFTVDEAIVKYMNILKLKIINYYDNEYYEKNKDNIYKIISIILTDLANTNKLSVDSQEDVVLYDDYWNKIRQPNVDSSLISDEIVGLNVILRPYQRAILHVMHQAETQKTIINIVRNKGEVLTMDAGCLSSHVGTGKTVMILAYILLLKQKGLNDVILSDKYYNYNENCIVKYAYNKIIKASFVFVNSSVFEQWREEIKTKTAGLNVVYIYDVASLKRVIADTKLIFNADLVLVKNGSVKTVFADWEVNRTQSDTRHLMNALASIFSEYVVSRIFIDDFDTTKMTISDGGLRTIFYWYVSATALKHRLSHNHENEMAPYPRAAPNWMFDNLAIYATNDFVTSCNKLPKIKVYIKYHECNNQKFMNIMAEAAKGDAVLSDIVEMISAESIDSAAERLGIKANSVNDVFKKILNRSYKPYMHALKMLECVKVLNTLKVLQHMEIDKLIIKQVNYAIRSGKYNCFKENLNVCFNEIKNAEDMFNNAEAEADIIDDTVKNFKTLLLEFKNDKIIEVMDNITKSATNQRNKEGAAIDRLRRSQTECQVCKAPLYDEDEPMDEDVKGAIVVTCCSKMFCSDCAIKGSKFVKHGGSINGNCPSCRADIKPDNLIYININNDIGNNLLVDDLNKIENTVAPAENTATPVETAPIEEPKKEYPKKFDSLLPILNGLVPENSVITKIEFKGLMNGTGEFADENRTSPKLLLIAKFPSTVAILQEFFTDNNIKWIRLMGSSLQKKHQVETFRSEADIKVMILVSSTDCAGLNGLQFVTDCVFLHKFVSQEIESQAIGRCQRLGRAENNPLRVHYLLYEHEY